MDKVYKSYATEEEINDKVEKYRKSNNYKKENEESLVKNLRENPAYIFKSDKKDIVLKDIIKGDITFGGDTLLRLCPRVLES